MTTVPFIPPVGIAGPAVPFVDAAAAGALAAGETLFPEAQAAQAQAAELASAHQELAILVGGKSRSGRSFQWPHTLIVNGLPVQGSRPETLDRTFFEGNAARISLREILEIFASPL
ncbi:MAG: hypothetical protein HY609_02060, partial [Deltaproteobacteria bacterium]|nr:hypothetical protein [Deltaproteobacteria bacterium]